jgi:YD repeat-containing protein
MGKKMFRFGAGLGVVVGLVLLLVILSSQPRVPGSGSLFGERNIAFARAGGLEIDHGDPLISDAHIEFMDRGRYPFQDMVSELGCGGGLVNVVYGNLVTSRQDIHIPGRGLPLEVRFTYNSGSFFDGRYGPGWQMNYNLRYVTNSANGNVIVVREDDRTDIFVEQQDGSFRSTYGVRDILVKLAGGGYALTDREGVKYWFNSPAHHYVTKIEDPNGNSLTFTYVSRNLTAVTDDAGRGLSFGYSGGKLVKITDPLDREFRYSYDDDGNLESVTDPAGKQTRYDYWPDCHDLRSITDANGNVRTITYNADYQVAELNTCCGLLRFAYDLPNGQTTVTDGNDHTTTYSYDAQKRVTAIEDAEGETTRTWDSSYNLTSVTDARGHTTTYEYDTFNRLIRVTEPGNPPIEYGYAASLSAGQAVLGKVTSVTDANGHTTRYQYDGSGNLIKIIDPLDKETTYSYDSHGQVTSRENARGYTTEFEYDQYGNLLKRTDSLDGETTYTYDSVGNRLSETDAESRTTSYSYDSLNRLWTVTDDLDRTVAYTYDPVGNLIKETDAKGRITSYSYDSLNRLVVITDALGCTIGYSYDPVGNRISETDANGNTTTYEYDSLNRLITVNDPLDQSIGYSYDPVGNRISETDANGNVTNYEYDPLNRLIRKETASGSTIAGRDPGNSQLSGTGAVNYYTNYSYDPVGNRISETDADGNITHYEYDPLNRLITVTNPLDQSIGYSYDPVGNRISETDANGNTISYSYDALNRLAVVTDAEGYTTTYEYDSVGHRISETDANHHQWEYEYDELDRVVKGTSPLGHETTFTYDEVGNRLTRTDPNAHLTQYTYDDLNRLVRVEYADGTGALYSYDCAGNTLAVTNTGGLGEVIERDYDAAHRLVSETIRYGAFSKTVKYEYDGVGNIVTLTDPDLADIDYEYDHANKLVKVTDPGGGETIITYDAAGRRTKVQYANGTWSQYTYDDANRVMSIATRDAANALLFQYDYTYDPAGRLLVVDRPLKPQPEAEFEYNKAGWLTHAEYPLAVPGQDIQYTYDNVGNRLTKDDKGQLTTYTYDAEDRVATQEQILPVHSKITYTHDLNGNMVQTANLAAQKWGFEYDPENRLVSFYNLADAANFTALYYSPEGHLLARQEGGVLGPRTYYYPTLKGVVVEMNAAGGTTTRLNPGISMAPGGALSGQGIQATPEAYMHWDARDSTPNFTDAGGAVDASFSFGYFGEMLDAPGDGADFEPGLYATGYKVDWDPLLGVEMIGGDYATDIAQHYGSTHFDPGERLGMEYDSHFVQWYSGSPWAFSDKDVKIKQDAMPPPPEPQQKAEKCTHGCYGWAWGSKYVEWKGEWKHKWTCRDQDYVEACQNGKPAAKTRIANTGTALVASVRASMAAPASLIG